MHEGESSNERHRSGHRRRHRHRSESRSHRHHHERRGRSSSAPQSDEHNWVFILVLTNFISLTVGAYVGHRYWNDILSLTGQEKQTSSRNGPSVEPMERAIDNMPPSPTN